MNRLMLTTSISLFVLAALFAVTCTGKVTTGNLSAPTPREEPLSGAAPLGNLPLRTLRDVPLGGGASRFDYQSLEGGWFRNTVEDILAQLFGRSWYHRGQIASLVRAAGGEPAVTDFVFWTREPIAPPDRR